MTKQLVRISILQSSKIMTALYVLMGCFYTLIGIPMIIFGGTNSESSGLFMFSGRSLPAFSLHLLRDFCRDVTTSWRVAWWN